MRTYAFTTVAIMLCGNLLASGRGLADDKPKSVSIPDFLIDHDSLADATVDLRGWLLTTGSANMLYERAGSMNAIFVDTEQLRPEEKKFLLSRCGGGCKVTLRGKAAEVMMNKGLEALAVVNPKVPGPKLSAKTEGSGQPVEKKVEKILRVSDVLADYDALGDAEIRVRGFVLSMGETSILYERAGSMTSLFLETSGLSRDERKYLMTKCDAGCSLEIVGTPGAVMMNKGLVVTKLQTRGK